MINLSAFGYEKDMNISDIIPETWGRKDFVNGQMVEKFEQSFAEYCNVDYCVGLGSCTSALQLSLIALDIGSGDEVITTPYTWVSSVECIRQVGATPVFADIGLKDFCIATDILERKITDRTKAIIGVDLFGNVCDIDELKKFNVPIIEDAAQSTGAKYKGKRVGGLADITCFSFYPTKNLSCWGDGGAITTNEKHFERRIRRLRNHGQTDKFQIEGVGWNSRLDTIHAEVLYRKLYHLDKWNARRKEIAEIYNNEFKGLFVTPSANEHSDHVWHQYVLLSKDMDKIKTHLNKNDIQARTYYPTPLHRSSPYWEEGSLHLASEHASENGLAIPVHQFLTDEDIERIIKKVKEAILLKIMQEE